MTRTRNQALRATIKIEESTAQDKNHALLHDPKAKKYKPSNPKVVIRTRFAPFKSLNVHVKQRTSKGNLRSPHITKEQIKKLIDYIEKDKLSVFAASRKTKMDNNSAQRYYQEYKNDPEHKLPVPKIYQANQSSQMSQEKINNLIRYITQDKMKVTHAAYKATMDRKTAAKYYKIYLDDPEHKVPTIDVHSNRYKQEQVDRFIRYVVEDKMTVGSAALKAHMDKTAAKKYYLMYLEDPNFKVPGAGKYTHRGGKYVTNEEVKSVIRCIVDEGMNLMEAAIKSNMGVRSARKYYREYMNDPDHKIPTPEDSNIRLYGKKHDLEQIKSFFRYFIVENLSVQTAAKKANISETTGYEYYGKYLRDPTRKLEDVDNTYTVEKMTKLVEYIEKDKLSFSAAVSKANLSMTTASKCYRQYLEDPEHKIPVINKRQYTPEEVKQLISYIEDDGMMIPEAAKKVDMGCRSAYEYYSYYRKDPEHKIPLPMPIGYARKHRTFDKYSQIVADIYKENPSIKPPVREGSYSRSCSVSTDNDTRMEYDDDEEDDDDAMSLYDDSD